LLGLWVRVPPGVWISVSLSCCVLSVRGVCFGLNTRPHKSYRVWCVTQCNREASRTRAACPTTESCTTKTTVCFRYSVTVHCDKFTVYSVVLNISSISHGVQRCQYMHNAGNGTRVLRILSLWGTSYTGVRWMIPFQTCSVVANVPNKQFRTAHIALPPMCGFWTFLRSRFEPTNSKIQTLRSFEMHYS
jgi:hypothetical protein